MGRIVGISFEFKDFLPLIAERVGAEGLISELRNGFHLLMDRQQGLITFESLKRSCVHLGLEGLEDNGVLSMLREGDLNRDGCLNRMEFCILMFRLSPDLMAGSRRALADALVKDLNHFMH